MPNMKLLVASLLIAAPTQAQELAKSVGMPTHATPAEVQALREFLQQKTQNGALTLKEENEPEQKTSPMKVAQSACVACYWI